MRNKTRPARLGGRWYPTDPDEIASYLPPKTPDDKAMAAICPHAGWVYSGRVAGRVYARVPEAETYVLVGVNHFSRGHPLSLSGADAWETPLGPLSVDHEISRKLMNALPEIREDPFAHADEHCLEVQTPFLARLFPKARVVPLLMQMPDPALCRGLGETLADIVRQTPRKVFLVATSDLSHVGAEYRNKPPKGLTADAFARRQDRLALEQIESLDGPGLLQTVKKHALTMCGAGPAAAVLHAAKMLGAARADTLAYATSSDVSGDRDVAVGYAGVLLTT